MHAPDGFLSPPVAVATAVLGTSAVAWSLRRSRLDLADRQIPLAGLTAAYVFAAQMVNFPVAAGTTGHLLGGLLAAVLLGPATGALVVAVVIAVQALVFADGGLSMLGVNVLNMAVVTSFGGYGLFRGFRRLLPATGPGVAAAGGLAGAGSVVLAAMAFSIEWLFGATAPVAFDRVFGAMVGVHLLIGIGEGVITATTLAAVLSARPDLVFGAADLDRSALAGRVRWSGRVAVLAGVLVVAVVATVVSQFAGTAPDGLEKVAADTGITAPLSSGAAAGPAGPVTVAPAPEGAPAAPEATSASPSPFADYATRGLTNRSASLAVAGGTGAALVGAVGTGLLVASRRQRGAGSAPVPVGAPATSSAPPPRSKP